MPNSIAITAENTFCTPVYIVGHGTLILSGTFTANVNLQASPNGVDGWVPTGDAYSSPGVNTFTDFTGQYYRAGVPSGGFTSGTVNLTLRGA